VDKSLARYAAFLRACGGDVWIVRLPPGPNGEKTGLDDYLARGGTFDNLVATATKANDFIAEQKCNVDEVVRRLAEFSPLRYDQIRLEEASQLGIRVSTLDREVAALRRESNDAGQGHTLELWEPEPSEETVDGAALLDRLVESFKRFAILPPGAPEALALWVKHCHAIDASDISPRLAVTSPIMQCGKTLVARDLTRPLVPRAQGTDNISSAAVFRLIEQARPTLLMDEADTFLPENEEMRGVLNSGHRRDGTVIRLVGDDHEARRLVRSVPLRCP
jgi:putative DNA primase/helicase